MSAEHHEHAVAITPAVASKLANYPGLLDCLASDPDPQVQRTGVRLLDAARRHWVTVTDCGHALPSRPAPHDAGLVLTTREAARLRGVSEVTLRRRARTGQVPAYRVGSAWLFPHDGTSADHGPALVSAREAHSGLGGAPDDGAGGTVAGPRRRPPHDLDTTRRTA